MPSAHPDLVKMWGGHQGIAEDKAIEFLQDRGYKFDPRTCRWIPPERVKTYKDMEHEEYDAMWFLVTEWDYGGLNEARPL